VTEPTDDNEAEARRAAQDEVIIAALAAGNSYSLTANLAGVSERTIARRMADPAFARVVADRRAEQVQTITGQLSSLGAEAVAAVASCLQDDEPKTRLAAGKLVLELVLKFRHQNDLELAVAEIRHHLGLDA
jgi:hypothetical protein